jgi:uncharacterized protein with beta-barrel porin domain
MDAATALQRFGDVAGDSDALTEAIRVWKLALADASRVDNAAAWVATQNNLGNALATLGSRESGTARLEEAVAAYRAALEEMTRDRAPVDWAMSTGNQGVVRRAAWRTGAGADHGRLRDVPRCASCAKRCLI